MCPLITADETAVVSENRCVHAAWMWVYHETCSHFTLHTTHDTTPLHTADFHPLPHVSLFPSHTRATHRTPHTPQLIFIATYVTSPSSQLSPHPLTLHTCHLTSHLSHQTEATVTDKKQFQEVVTNVWKS